MTPEPEFSRLHRLGTEPSRLVLRANATERAALAARFLILGIGRLEAEIELTGAPDGIVRLNGRLRADVEQACVVTLEPVAQQVDVPLALRILPAGVAAGDDDPDSPDEIETSGGFVDLGEVLAEQLALALDPYPRAPDAALPAELDAALAVEEEAPTAAVAPAKPNPFAALSRLKKN